LIIKSDILVVHYIKDLQFEILNFQFLLNFQYFKNLNVGFHFKFQTEN